MLESAAHETVIRREQRSENGTENEPCRAQYAARGAETAGKPRLSSKPARRHGQLRLGAVSHVAEEKTEKWAKGWGVRGWGWGEAGWHA